MSTEDDKRVAVGTNKFPPVLSLSGTCFFFLLLFHLTGGQTPAFALDFYGQWNYSIAGGGKGETVDAFHQIYKVNDSIELEPTDAIKAYAGIQYTWDKRTYKGKYDIINPQAGIGLSNDIFGIGLSAIATRYRYPKQEINTSNWETSLSPGSLFVKKYWPTLRLYYAESTGKLTYVDGVTGYDNWNSDYGADVGWELPGVQLFYGYSNYHTENKIAMSEEDTIEHYGRLYTEGTFLDNSFNFRLTQSVSNKTEDFSAIVPAIGAVELTFSDNQGYQIYALQETVTGPGDPDCIAHDQDLSSNPSPNLKNLDNKVPLVIGPGLTWDLGVGVPGIFPLQAFPEITQVQQLRVYVDDPFGDMEMDQNELQWHLYASFDNINWVPVDCSIMPLYNSSDQRFEMDIPVLEQSYEYFMVEVSNNSDEGLDEFSLGVLAVEAVSFLPRTPGSTITATSEGTDYTTTLLMSFQISPTLRASSHLDLLYSEGYSNEFIHSNITWRPYTFMAPSLEFDVKRVESTGYADSITRNYGLHIPITILPTLSVSVGITKRERYSGDQKITQSDSYLLNAYAILFPDLTASLNMSYNTGTVLKPDGITAEDENWLTTISLSARLFARLTADLETSETRYYKPITDTARYSSLKLNYRPSDYLAMDLRYVHIWLGPEGDFLRYNLNLALLRTYKTRVDFLYAFQKTENDWARNNFGLQLNWDISRVLTLRSQANYLLYNLDAWSVNTWLYMRL